MSLFTQGGVARSALMNCPNADRLGSSAVIAHESWKYAPGRYAAMALGFGTRVREGAVFMRETKSRPKNFVPGKRRC